MRLPFDRCLNLIWYWRTRYANQEQREQLAAALAPPAPRPTRPWTPGHEPTHIPRPSWFKGDRAAFAGNKAAASALGETVPA